MLVALIAAPPAARAQDAQDYVGSASCTACHAEAAEAWSGSDHALAWTEATAANILADFNDTEFVHDGMTARFSVEPDGTHVITVYEKDGKTTRYPVQSVAGVAPLQQYLLETEPGRLQSFDVVWDTEKGDWFHLYPDQDLPPDDGLHWTGPYKTWNARCAECHATGYEKNFDPRTKTYASTQAEIGVGCEACHGPARQHLDWARAATTQDPPPNYGFRVDFSDREAAIQQCATCHSRRESHLDGNPLPGTPYHDAYNLALLRPGLYQADGQIEDEVYVYGSFLQSKMYDKGVGCVDCHNPHAIETLAEGNALCTQCHNPAGNPRFPTLKPAEYDSPEHHFHEPGSEGAQCASCHMPQRVYMGNDWRRDHSFRIPRPDLADQTGASDACTDCHRDRKPDWAAAAIAERFPDGSQSRPHYGTVLARGRQDPVAAATDLAALAEDQAQPGIVRATALWLLRASNSPTTATRLVPLLDDPDPVVRAAAAGLQRLAPPAERAGRLARLLDDPIRTVRIEAARELLMMPPDQMPAAAQAPMRAAFGEWREAVSQRLDFPETHLQLAGTALTLRNFPAAAGAFDEVVQMDPQRVDAWIMLARLAALSGGPRAARAVIDRARAVNPGDASLDAFLADLNGQGGMAAPPPPPAAD
ncbi:tetratricopeptide repeat protein [Paracoccus sp. XHP0099]|uniref:Tetratricopeptide repeat protein n=2 Tax=Paracoccus marinaquae TaxID=2841926 RepID=A0ABS6ADQ5_9RHOB|nr:tetratricopeptide repeat protein [Paracoccus marinaquae]